MGLRIAGPDQAALHDRHVFGGGGHQIAQPFDDVVEYQAGVNRSGLRARAGAGNALDGFLGLDIEPRPGVRQTDRAQDEYREGN